MLQYQLKSHGKREFNLALVLKGEGRLSRFQLQRNEKGWRLWVGGAKNGHVDLSLNTKSTRWRGTKSRYSIASLFTEHEIPMPSNIRYPWVTLIVVDAWWLWLLLGQSNFELPSQCYFNASAIFQTQFSPRCSGSHCLSELSTWQIMWRLMDSVNIGK